MLGGRRPQALSEAGTSVPSSASSARYYVRSAILHFDGHSWSLFALPDPGVPYIATAGFALPLKRLAAALAGGAMAASLGPSVEHVERGREA